MPRKIQVCICASAFCGHQVSSDLCADPLVPFPLTHAAPDVDAVAGWLGSYGGEDSPGDISRGVFAAEVGVPRLLKLFKKYGITTTWFIPGHSLESFPKEMAMIRDAGHEIGLHGYSHENRECGQKF